MEIYGKIVDYITEEVNRLRKADRVCKQIANTYEEKGLLKAYEIVNKCMDAYSILNVRNIPFTESMVESIVIELEFVVAEMQAYSDTKAYQHTTMYEVYAINKLIAYIENLGK